MYIEDIQAFNFVVCHSDESLATFFPTSFRLCRSWIPSPVGRTSGRFPRTSRWAMRATPAWCGLWRLRPDLGWTWGSHATYPPGILARKMDASTHRCCLLVLCRLVDSMLGGYEAFALSNMFLLMSTLNKIWYTFGWLTPRYLTKLHQIVIIWY